MTEHILIGIVFVLVLGIGAQWLAWRFRVPSILLLLTLGFLAGPVTGLLDPAELQGDWVFAFVSLAIGLILFEGGLSLRLSELREVGQAVLNLITIGVLVTWLLAGLGAYYIAGFNVSLSVLIGAILTVTGPTVVIPLLRHVRPTGRVGVVAKWEGITIDPVGAILAVLVLETILLLQQSVTETGGENGFGAAALHAVEGLLLTIFISVGISVIGAALLILLLHRRLVPDYLQSAVALMVVAGTFALSNVLQEESGLLEVVLMGIMLANQKYVPVRRIIEFKENLQVLLLAGLFILLSARLELSALQYIDTNAFIFLAVLILLVRPLSVVLASLGTSLNWREQTFLAWLAPRGVVAAAVASLFTFRLERFFPEEVGGLVPIVFLVIVGTVAVYGLTISPLARYLGLAHPNPQGVLILGGHAWAQQIAQALQRLDFKVLLIDSNVKNVEQARRKGLPAKVSNALSESAIDELDLGGLGSFLALTPNDEVNSLATLHFAEVFESSSIYQIAAARLEGQQEYHVDDAPSHLRGRPLFGEATTFSALHDRFQKGGEIKTFELSADLTYDMLQARYDDDLVLLFVVRGTEVLVHSQKGHLSPVAGDKVIVFLPALSQKQAVSDEASFEQLVAEAFVLDQNEITDFEELVEEAVARFAQHLPVTASRLKQGFLEAMRYSAVLAHGVALPHYRVVGIDEPQLVMVRCRAGLPAPSIGLVPDDAESPPLAAGEEQDESIYALFFLVSPEDNPGRHLRTLATLAMRIDSEHFMEQWLEAADQQELKETLIHPERYLSLALSTQDRTSAYVGQAIEDLDLPTGSTVMLVRRNNKLFIPSGHTVLNEGDHITITADPAIIRKMRAQFDLVAEETSEP